MDDRERWIAIQASYIESFNVELLDFHWEYSQIGVADASVVPRTLARAVKLNDAADNGTLPDADVADAQQSNWHFAVGASSRDEAGDQFYDVARDGSSQT